MKTILKSTTIWAAFIPIAILNGAFRDKCLVPLLGQQLALVNGG